MFDIVKKYKYSLIFITLIVGGYFVYVTFGSPSVPEGLLTQSATVDGTAAGQEILQILADIQNINLDTSIFQDDKFNSLVDFTQGVTSEPQGRRNPFEQIGFGIDIEGKIAEPTKIVDTVEIIEATQNILPE